MKSQSQPLQDGKVLAARIHQELLKLSVERGGLSSNACNERVLREVGEKSPSSKVYGEALSRAHKNVAELRARVESMEKDSMLAEVRLSELMRYKTLCREQDELLVGLRRKCDLAEKEVETLRLERNLAKNALEEQSLESQRALHELEKQYKSKVDVLQAEVCCLEGELERRMKSGKYAESVSTDTKLVLNRKIKDLSLELQTQKDARVVLERRIREQLSLEEELKEEIHSLKFGILRGEAYSRQSSNSRTLVGSGGQNEAGTPPAKTVVTESGEYSWSPKTRVWTSSKDEQLLKLGDIHKTFFMREER